MAPLVFVGFMGCGKSRVGRCVAERLQRDFVDLDDSIEDRAGRTIPEIFTEQGEHVFRHLETEALAAHLGADHPVIATGGGAWLSERNRALSRAAGAVSVFLEVPWEVLLERLSRHPEKRPLFTDPASARRLYRERLPVYRTADLLVQTDGRESADQVALRVIGRVREEA
jgi:shikimate kinase